MKNLEEILQRQFSLQTGAQLPDEESAYLNELQKRLAERIKYYINTDLEYLLQVLYRVDVPQSLTDEAFDRGEIDLISMDLSEKIIRRQLQKIEYSKSFYSEDK